MTTKPCSLVTGGAGFIGSHVAYRMCQQGHTVIVLDDLIGGFRENLPVQNIFVHGSILDVALVDDPFVRHRFQYVYH